MSYFGCDTKKFRTKDSIKLIEYSFKNFEYVNISEKIDQKFLNWKKENQDYFNINKGINSNLQIKYSDLETPIIPIHKNQIPSIQISLNINQNFDAPIYENTKIGEIVVNTNEGIILNCDILANNTIRKKNLLSYWFEFFKIYSIILNSSSKLLP